MRRPASSPEPPRRAQPVRYRSGMSEQPLPDPVRIRAELGLPPIGTKLTREQSLRMHRALWGEPTPEGVAWARKALGLSPSDTDRRSA